VKVSESGVFGGDVARFRDRPRGLFGVGLLAWASDCLLEIMGCFEAALSTIGGGAVETSGEPGRRCGVTGGSGADTDGESLPTDDGGGGVVGCDDEDGEPVGGAVRPDNSKSITRDNR
jgi:hypothetical protein